MKRPATCLACLSRSLTTIQQTRRLATQSQDLQVQGQTYARDDTTNATPSILAKVPLQLLHQPAHPLGILRSLIEQSFPGFQPLLPSTPAVTVYSNFDELGFPKDHPGRAATDSYYLNASHMLRTHTSAHEVDVFRQGIDKWLLSADVYRRDEIDRSHYPVFHQMEGAYVLPRSQVLSVMEAENKQMEDAQIQDLKSGRILIEDETHGGTAANPWQPEHLHVMNETLAVDKSLKLHLNKLVLGLFGKGLEVRGKTDEPLRIRWLEDAFPFTSPSYQLEVWFEGQWLEILGCGVVKQYTLNQAGCVTCVPDKMGWAFGLGLDRIAMILFGIPDIRLFWSQDERFASQFTPGQLSIFQPYSKYPACFKDVSFWAPDDFHENIFCDIVRDVAGDLVADVQVIDNFVHPKTKRKSLCYRINYQSMDRNLLNEEVNQLQSSVIDAIVAQMGVEIR